MKNDSNPPAYAYVMAIGAIILALILLPLIWSILKGVLKLALSLLVIALALYGIYTLVNAGKHSR